MIGFKGSFIEIILSCGTADCVLDHLKLRYYGA